MIILELSVHCSRSRRYDQGGSDANHWGTLQGI